MRNNLFRQSKSANRAGDPERRKTGQPNRLGKRGASQCAVPLEKTSAGKPAKTFRGRQQERARPAGRTRKASHRAV
jgi:hypothetical protein